MGWNRVNLSGMDKGYRKMPRGEKNNFQQGRGGKVAFELDVQLEQGFSRQGGREGGVNKGMCRWDSAKHRRVCPEGGG